MQYPQLSVLIPSLLQFHTNSKRPSLPHIRAIHRPRLQTAPTTSSSPQAPNPLPTTPSTSAQLALKYLDESSANFNLPGTLFPLEGHDGDMRLLRIPHELPILTLDDNF